MQKIAFTIFEVAKQALVRGIPQDQMLQAIEHHVNKAYLAGLDALEKKNLISAEMKEHAAKQSNIDDMAKKVQEEEDAAKQEQATQQVQQVQQPVQAQQGQRPAPVKATGKAMKLLSVALLLKVLSQDKVVTILDKFSQEDTQLITQYMQAPDLEAQLDAEVACQCLKEIREYLPKKPKLSEDAILRHLQRSFDRTSRDNVEKLIKHERPFVKRFISSAYDEDYYNIPLRVAGVIAQYVQDSI
jgi:hypothetical protein